MMKCYAFYSLGMSNHRKGLVDRNITGFKIADDRFVVLRDTLRTEIIWNIKPIQDIPPPKKGADDNSIMIEMKFMSIRIKNNGPQIVSHYCYSGSGYAPSIALYRMRASLIIMTTGEPILICSGE